MTSATQTHIGYVREENQDRVGSRQFGENLLLLVCDGMGGERSGSKASSLASEVFFENFEEGYEPDMDHYSMGTTCVAAFISQTYIAIANVGDSRAYYWAEDTLQQITVDHTRVQALLEQGEITEDEMATHPQRHMLVKAVGVERTVCPDFFRIDRVDSQPFILLLCSDGLSGFCSDAEIQEVLDPEKPAEEITQQLVDMALQKGGRDNISVAVAVAAASESVEE